MRSEACSKQIFFARKRVLSYPILSCPVLSCPTLSCPALSCLALPCPVLSCPVLCSMMSQECYWIRGDLQDQTSSLLQSNSINSLIWLLFHFTYLQLTSELYCTVLYCTVVDPQMTLSSSYHIKKAEQRLIFFCLILVLSALVQYVEAIKTRGS